MLRFVTARTAALVMPVLAVLALGLGSSLPFVPVAHAQHKMSETDMELPIDDPEGRRPRP